MLDGGGGRDTLEGGRGEDVLVGGGGADRFVFGRRSGEDVVRDFAPGEDVLVIEWRGASFDELDVERDGDGVRVAFGDDEVLIRDVTGLERTDFDFG